MVHPSSSRPRCTMPARPTSAAAVVLRTVTVTVMVMAMAAEAIDNGLGRRPPMGWRGWLLFGEEPTQQRIESILPAMVARNWSVDGKPTSLCDLGYCDVGLDNGWAKCHQSTKNGSDTPYSYHTAAGAPIVNTQRFPSMANMTAKAHALNLTMGWYGNLCGGCQEKNATPAMYAGDVTALVDYGYDGIKLDGCGAE